MKNIFKINNLTYVFILTTFLCGYIKNMLIILGIILFHELGHVIISLILGYKIKSVEIFPFGGITKIDIHLNDNSLKQLFLAIGGILFQLILFLFIKDPLIISYNKSILLFNLLPIIPLDGSKILFELLSTLFSYKKVIKISCFISILSIIIYIYINYHYVLNNYLIVLLFLYKTINFYRYRHLMHHKFILERILYDFSYYGIENNYDTNDYKKGIKYYYFNKNKVISQKEYLKSKYLK